MRPLCMDVLVEDAERDIVRTKSELKLKLERTIADFSVVLNRLETEEESKGINSLGEDQGRGADLDRLIGKFAAQRESLADLKYQIQKARKQDEMK